MCGPSACSTPHERCTPLQHALSYQVAAQGGQILRNMHHSLHGVRLTWIRSTVVASNGTRAVWILLHKRLRKDDHLLEEEFLAGLERQARHFM